MTSGLLKNELIQQSFMRVPRDESRYAKDEVKLNQRYAYNGPAFDMALLCVHLKQGNIRAGKFMKIDGVPYIVVDTDAKSSPQLFENVNSILLRKAKY